MTTQLAFTATDTVTGEQRIITHEYVEGLSEFSIDYLDTEFEYDDFNVENVELTDPQGFPDYVDNSTEDIEKAFDSFTKIGENLWDKATELSDDMSDLVTLGGVASELLYDDLFDVYLDYAENQNYLPSASTFNDAYQGTFDSRTDFVYSLIHGGLYSADEIIEQNGTVEHWAESGDLRFDYSFIDKDERVEVFLIV